MAKLTKSEKELESLTAKVIAMVVRNEMEDFHVKNLSDKQMAELNPLIRNAIYSALLLIQKTKKGDKRSQDLLNFNLQLIPSYWEEPKDIFETQKNEYQKNNF